MFMVLTVHTDFYALRVPTTAFVAAHPMNAATRFFFEALSIGCVDVFILISGWFGIRASVKGFCNLIFQCLFFGIGIYGVMCAFRLVPFGLEGVAECFLLTPALGFVKAYMCLYLLSPVLNAFVATAGRKIFRNLLFSYFIFQTLYGWMSAGAGFFEAGHATISFIGIYLLARYIKVYRPKCFSHSPAFHLSLYLFISVVLALVAFCATHLQQKYIADHLWYYNNPLVIMSALSLLLAFDGMPFRSKTVNGMAASCFAIYLLHQNPNLAARYYIANVRELYKQYDGIACIFVLLLFMVLVAVLAILLDQPRKWCWGKWLAPLYDHGKKGDEHEQECGGADHEAAG